MTDDALLPLRGVCCGSHSSQKGQVCVNEKTCDSQLGGRAGGGGGGVAGWGGWLANSTDRRRGGGGGGWLANSTDPSIGRVFC